MHSLGIRSAALLVLLLTSLHIVSASLISSPSESRKKVTRAALPDLYEASVFELQEGLEYGYFTSVDLVQAYFARIDEVNLQGPQLRAVIETNPSALAQAAALDLERQTTGPRSLLHGIPVLVKDNIATIVRRYEHHCRIVQYARFRRSR